MTSKLPKIADLIGLEVEPEGRKRKKPKTETLSLPLACPDDASSPVRYEYEVFEFLLKNKVDLGIESVVRYKNLFVDGAIQLVDGLRLAVEIKLRMNWTKALQAVFEFRQFLLTSEAANNPVKGAVVFFERFQGDGWHKGAKTRLLENGGSLVHQAP